MESNDDEVQKCPWVSKDDEVALSVVEELLFSVAELPPSSSTSSSSSSSSSSNSVVLSESIPLPNSRVITENDPFERSSTTDSRIEEILLTPEPKYNPTDFPIVSPDILLVETSSSVLKNNDRFGPKNNTENGNMTTTTPVKSLPPLLITNNRTHNSFLDPFPTPTGGNWRNPTTSTADDTAWEDGQPQDLFHFSLNKRDSNTNYVLLRHRKRTSQNSLPLDETTNNEINPRTRNNGIATTQHNSNHTYQDLLGSNNSTIIHFPTTTHATDQDTNRSVTSTTATTPLRRQILLQQIQNTSKRLRRKLKLSSRRYSRRSSSSSSSLLLQQQKSSQVSSWLIPADHPLKLAWDVTTVCISLVSAYVTHTSIQERDYDRTGFLIRFCEIWFLLDIFLNFVTQYRYTPPGVGAAGSAIVVPTTSTGPSNKTDTTTTTNSNNNLSLSTQQQQGCIVLASPQKVWARYLTTWFLIDVISFIPWEKIWVKPIVEMQKRRNIVQKVGRRSKVVLKIGRMLRGRHIRWFKNATRWTKRVVGYDGGRLLVLIIKYIPKYFTFVKNMKAVLAIRLLRQIHWLRKVMGHLYNRDKKGEGAGEDEVGTREEEEEIEDESTCCEFSSDEEEEISDDSVDNTEQSDNEINDDYEPPFC
jgi:hypothetical protein